MTELTVYRTTRVKATFAEPDRVNSFGFLSLEIEDRIGGKLEITLFADNKETEEILKGFVTVEE